MGTAKFKAYNIMFIIVHHHYGFHGDSKIQSIQHHVHHCASSLWFTWGQQNSKHTTSCSSLCIIIMVFMGSAKFKAYNIMFIIVHHHYGFHWVSKIQSIQHHVHHCASSLWFSLG